MNLPKDDSGDDFDINEFKENISTYLSPFLCDIIVSNRYILYNNDLQIICMQELSKRRHNGDQFDFESYIDNKTKELPPIDFKGIAKIIEILKFDGLK